MSDYIVIDCCISMTWLQQGTAPKKSRDYAAKILSLFQTGSVALVPSLWHYEISNVLTTLIRNDYINEVDMLEFVEILDKLPIREIKPSGVNHIPQIVSLAKQYELSAYDASYLNLAYSYDCPLATLDKKLIKAAKQCNLYWC